MEPKKLTLHTLFRNKRYTLNEMFQQNASKFAIIYKKTHVVFFVFHFVQLYIFTLWLPWWSMLTVNHHPQKMRYSKSLSYMVLTTVVLSSIDISKVPKSFDLHESFEQLEFLYRYLYGFDLSNTNLCFEQHHFKGCFELYKFRAT